MFRGYATVEVSKQGNRWCADIQEYRTKQEPSATTFWDETQGACVYRATAKVSAYGLWVLSFQVNRQAKTRDQIVAICKRYGRAQQLDGFRVEDDTVDLVFTVKAHYADVVNDLYATAVRIVQDRTIRPAERKNRADLCKGIADRIYRAHVAPAAHVDAGSR